MSSHNVGPSISIVPSLSFTDITVTVRPVDQEPGPPVKLGKRKTQVLPSETSVLVGTQTHANTTTTRCDVVTVEASTRDKRMQRKEAVNLGQLIRQTSLGRHPGG